MIHVKRVVILASTAAVAVGTVGAIDAPAAGTTWSSTKCQTKILKWEAKHPHRTKKQLKALVRKYHRKHGCPNYKVR